jgi:hypothetical protein
MAQDPLYHDQRQMERMTGDREIMPRLVRLQWLKLATGAIALALIAAIWFTWRYG